jgi:hypothetical protein
MHQHRQSEVSPDRVGAPDDDGLRLLIAWPCGRTAVPAFQPVQIEPQSAYTQEPLRSTARLRLIHHLFGLDNPPQRH